MKDPMEWLKQHERAVAVIVGLYITAVTLFNVIRAIVR